MKTQLLFNRGILMLTFLLSTSGIWAQANTTDPDYACINSTESYWVVNTPGSTYNWVLSGGGTIVSGQTTSAIQVLWSNAGPWVLTVTETFTSTTGCDGLPVSLNIIVQALPLAFNVTGGGSYCIGGTGVSVGLSDSETGINYQLQRAGVDVGALIPGTDNAIDFGLQTIAGTYTVVASSSNGCSTPMTGNALVTIDPLPVPTISGLTSVATLINTVYTTEAGMTNYIWVISAGGTIVAGGTSNDNTVTVVWNTSGPQTVSVNYDNLNGCSASTATLLNVTVGVLPVPTITGPSPVCVNTLGNVYTTEAGMTNYIWVVSAGGVITSGGTATDNTITITWNTVAPQSVSVNYTNGDGYTAAGPTVKAITIDALPVTSPIWHN
jgi:hypothetical protein